MENRKPCTVSGNVNWCSHYREQYGERPQKIKNTTTSQFGYFTPGCVSGENENPIIQKDTCTPVHLQ